MHDETCAECGVKIDPTNRIHTYSSCIKVLRDRIASYEIRRNLPCPRFGLGEVKVMTSEEELVATASGHVDGTLFQIAELLGVTWRELRDMTLREVSDRVRERRLGPRRP